MTPPPLSPRALGGADRDSPGVEARWGESSPWSVGAEEELMLVDAQDAAPGTRVAGRRRRAERELGPGRIKTELFASVVELNTGACESAGEAAARLGSCGAPLRRSPATGCGSSPPARIP
jgi:hypothetical protein